MATQREKLVKIGAKVTRYSLLHHVRRGRSGGHGELVRDNSRPRPAVGDPAAGRGGASRVGKAGGQKCGSQGARSSRPQRSTLEKGPTAAARAGLQTKKVKNFTTRKTRGPQLVRMGSVESLEQFQAQSRWEISD